MVIKWNLGVKIIALIILYVRFFSEWHPRRQAVSNLYEPRPRRGGGQRPKVSAPCVTLDVDNLA